MERAGLMVEFLQDLRDRQEPPRRLRLGGLPSRTLVTTV